MTHYRIPRTSTSPFYHFEFCKWNLKIGYYLVIDIGLLVLGVFPEAIICDEY